MPMARMVGPSGRVIAVDIQEGMLRNLQRRASKAGLADRIELRLATYESLGINDLAGHGTTAGKVDFVLLFAVVHEISNQYQMFAEIAATLKPDAQVLIAEPRGHVGPDAFAATVALARAHGLEVVDEPKISRNRAVLMKRAVK